MLYDLSKHIDKSSFKAKVNLYYEEQATVILKVKPKIRTIKQNRYLHLILSWFALEYGETMEYVKQYFFKQIVNAAIFKSEYINKKTGEVRDNWRSTSDLSTTELTICIERFRDYAAKEANIYLPEANEREFLDEIETQILKYEKYI